MTGRPLGAIREARKPVLGVEEGRGEELDVDVLEVGGHNVGVLADDNVVVAVLDGAGHGGKAEKAGLGGEPHVD